MPGEPPGSAARAGAFGAGLERWAPWAAGIVLVAGVAPYAGTRLASGSSAPAPAGSVRLDPKAARVAREFVATAVARRHLARAWELAAPDLKQGMTLAEWNTGTIPVTPYRGDVRAARY